MSISIARSVAAIIHEHCGNENFQLLQGNLSYPEEIFATSIDDLIDSELISESDIPSELKGKFIGYMVLPTSGESYRDEGGTIDDLFIVNIETKDSYVLGEKLGSYSIEEIDKLEFTKENDGTLARDMAVYHNNEIHIKETILIIDIEDKNGKDRPVAYELLYTVDCEADYAPLYTGYKSTLYCANKAKIKIYSEGISIELS